LCERNTKHTAKLCKPGSRFHESTIFLFVLFTNKGKSARINDFFVFYHQKYLIALKLFFSLNLKKKNELSLTNVIK